MSVESHLGVRPAEYDRRIATFIPFYDELLVAVATALDPRARRILDLGIGTGALSASCLTVARRARIVGIDTDEAILRLAKARLGKRVRLVCADFETAPFPPADAIVASLALHHIRTQRRKQRLYKRVAAALRRGGVFINADCCPATHRNVAAHQRHLWRRHLLKTYSPRQTSTFFRSWRREDVYMPLGVELQIMRAAGFATDIAWRRGAFAVVVAHRL